MGWTEEHEINRFGTLKQQCTGKGHFSTRKYARQVAKEWSKQTGWKYRWYKCQVCTRYHLTRIHTKEGTDQ